MVEDVVRGYFFLVAEQYISAAQSTDTATEQQVYEKIRNRIPDSEEQTLRRVLNPIIRYLQDHNVIVRDSSSGYDGKGTVTIRGGENIDTTLENLFDGFSTKGEKLTLPPHKLKPVNGKSPPTLAEICGSMIRYEQGRMPAKYMAAE